MMVGDSELDASIRVFSESLPLVQLFTLLFSLHFSQLPVPFFSSDCLRISGGKQNWNTLVQSLFFLNLN